MHESRHGTVMAHFRHQAESPSNSPVMNNNQIEPYLFFGGRCEEALEFYRTVLGAQVDMTMRFNQSPEPMPPGSIPAGFERKVMHASFRIGDSRLMASDGNAGGAKFEGFSLSLV